MLVPLQLFASRWAAGSGGVAAAAMLWLFSRYKMSELRNYMLLLSLKGMTACLLALRTAVAALLKLWRAARRLSHSSTQRLVDDACPHQYSTALATPQLKPPSGGVAHGAACCSAGSPSSSLSSQLSSRHALPASTPHGGDTGFKPLLLPLPVDVPVPRRIPVSASSAAPPMCVSFSGCAWLVHYHFGAAKFLFDKVGREWLRKCHFLGTSR
jgi:hypothetical protein